MIERARQRLQTAGRRTVFFLDEIHRFNKAQQDALLPAVEDGLITLIGATTENPYFEVNSALISRSRVYELDALGPPTCSCCCDRAVERGYCGPARADRRPRRSSSSPSAPAATRGSRSTRSSWPARQPGRPARAGDARARRGRAAAAGAPLRPSGRSPLRHDLGLDQGDPRLGSRRLAVLPGGDARGRRGPALHRPADGGARLRGHRQRRPPGAVRGHRGRGRGRARGAARVPVRARPGRDLPVPGAEVRRGQARGVRRARSTFASRAPTAPAGLPALLHPQRRATTTTPTAAPATSRPRSCCPTARSAPASTSPTTPRRRLRDRLAEIRRARGRSPDPTGRHRITLVRLFVCPPRPTPEKNAFVSCARESAISPACRACWRRRSTSPACG